MIGAISGKTGILCVIGDPVEHTMSPKMHNAAIAELGLDLVYVACHVTPDALEAAIAGLRALGVLGINVTIPHKIAVMQWLDEIDDVSQAIGAVNTIKNESGRLLGRNTDADGAVLALESAGVPIEGQAAIVLGAGGAARAIGFGLVRAGCGVTLLARRPEEAVKLAADIATCFPAARVDHDSLSPETLGGYVQDASLLVNATPVGMSPNFNDCPVDKDILRPQLVVFDLVYNPLETELLRWAKQAGCMVVPGIDMLVNQGALAFEWWTGVSPPVDIMKRAALEWLE
jgi:shikimate dehydrogenase